MAESSIGVVYIEVAPSGKDFGKKLEGDITQAADNAAKTFLNQLFQRPSGTVSGQHGQIVNMDIAVYIGLGDFLIIDFRQPVIGRNRSRVV